MPHLVLSSPPIITYPFEESGYHFIDYFEQSPSNGLIWVQYQQKNFFLRQQQKQDHILLKCDKQTRISPIGIIKDALNIYKNRFSHIIIHDNLSRNTLRQQENSSFLISPNALYEKLKYTSSVQLEIGFGSGRRILDDAKKHPHRLFIGVEIHTPSIEQVLRQIALQNLNNLYILACDARILLESLPTHCIDEIIVHFPIPWKKQHRRIFNGRFIMQVQQVIKKQGRIHLRSDDEEYFKESLDLILESEHSHCEIFKNKSITVSSKYEDRWHRQNKNIFDLFWYIDKQDTSKLTHHSFDFSPEEIKRLYQIFLVTTNYHKQITPSALLSIKAIYRSNNQALAVSLCMGSLAYPQNTYLILTPHEAFYCPNLFVIDANHEAHELLKQYHTNQEA